MSAVVVTAVFTPLPGKESALVDALRACLPAIHEEPGCVYYTLNGAEDGRVVMVEKWASRADLDAHDVSPGTQALRAAIADLVAAPVAVEFLTPIPAGTAEQGAL